MITSTLRLGKRISLVIWLIDQYTGLGCNERDVTVYLNGKPAVFQRKAGGYLVFTDLPGDVYQVRVEAAHYFSQELEVSLQEIVSRGRVVYVSLVPAPDYPFATSATLLRASVGQGALVSLTATLLTDNCARAKLGRQGAGAGSKEVFLVDVTMFSAPGDLLLIRAAEGSQGELCEIDDPGSGEGLYLLKAPLHDNHERGELLLPVVKTTADERGEVVIAFRNFRQRECQVKLEVKIGEKISEQEFTVTLGRTTMLGNL